jgi:hypothetical protein
MPYSRNLPNRTRVGGSGFTAFFWRSVPIGFCRQLAHVSPTPVGEGPTPIHPLDEPYPIDIVTPAAQNIGTLTMELYELYNRKVWDQLSLITGSIDLVNIFIKIAAEPHPIDLVKVVTPPTLRGKKGRAYSDRFHQCVITNVEDGETIEVGTMAVTKRISVAYTYMTRDGYDHVDSTNLAYALRDGRISQV